MTKTAMEMIGEARSQVGSVSAAQAAAEMSSGQAVFLDVREPEEWQHGHIDRSVPAPRGLLKSSQTRPAPATRKPWTPRTA